MFGQDEPANVDLDAVSKPTPAAIGPKDLYNVKVPAPKGKPIFGLPRIIYTHELWGQHASSSSLWLTVHDPKAIWTEEEVEDPVEDDVEDDRMVPE